MSTEHLRIEPDDLHQRLQTLGRLGDTGNGGCCRLALSDADRAGRDLVCGWMRELGLRVRIDPSATSSACAPGARTCRR
jgi:N-carbamoyl-L-amino-acid hydrolase